MSTLPAATAPTLGPVVESASFTVSSAIYVFRWLVVDTFRQARASGILALMLAISALCILLCLSIGIRGETRLSGEFIPRNDPRAADPESAAKAGVDVVSGEITFAFGAIRIPLARDAVDATRFVQSLLGVWVADAAGVLLVLIWTAGFLPTFLDPSSAAVMLAKPVPRWIMLVGKYLGVLTFVAFQAVVFVGGTWLALGVRTGVWDPSYFWCVPLLLLHFGIFFSFSALLAVSTRSTVACVFGSILFWMLCWGMNIGRHTALTVADVSASAGSFTFAFELGYWLLPKPADLSMVLMDSLRATEFFGPSVGFQGMREQGAFHPEWSILASVAFAVVMLGIAAYEFVTADY
jgi:ABC-type transport system involved in multi-copper enzyme maturation permease subunit